MQYYYYNQNHRNGSLEFIVIIFTNTKQRATGKTQLCGHFLRTFALLRTLQFHNTRNALVAHLTASPVTTDLYDNTSKND